MSEVEIKNKLSKIQEANASESAIRRYLFEQESGITYNNGERQVNTGFKKMQEDINSLMSELDKNPEINIDNKKELAKSKNWLQLYAGNKESIYKDLLLNDTGLTLLQKPENGSKNIDSQLIMDELGKEKGSALLSQYFIKNQLKIRQNIESLDAPSVLTMIDAFAEKNKIGLNNNEHLVTINLEKKGPFNNEEFANFISKSPDLKYKQNDYYYNHEQKGWKSFRNSEAVQLAYLKDAVNKVNDPKLTNTNALDNQMALIDGFFKEAKVEERKLPNKNNNSSLRF